jgi:hypothetical protein
MRGLVLSLLCFTSLWLFSREALLQLNNGTRLEVSSLHLSSQAVVFVYQGKQMRLPLNQVDLQRSFFRNDAGEADGSLAESLSSRETRPSVTLKTSDLKTKSTKSFAELPYRRVGNTIVVEVVINGAGPFPIVFDTGASKTVISKDTLARLRLPLSGTPAPMVGLSSQQVMGHHVRLPSLSLGGMEQRPFEVVSFDIEMLTQAGFIGLLGQDFLNHYTVTMDNARQVIILERHGASLKEHAAVGATVDVAQLVEEWENTGTMVQSCEQVLTTLLAQWHRLNPGERQRQAQALGGTLRDLTTCRSRFQSILYQLKFSQQNQSESGVTSIDQVHRCGSKVSAYVTALIQVAKDLQRHVQTENQDLLGRERLLNDMRQKGRAIHDCLNTP